MHCTQCGAEGSGRFCGPCGASLVELPCPACGLDLPPGTRFCIQCGSPLRTREGAAGPVSGGSQGSTVLPWAVSGVLLTALLVVAGMTVFQAGPAAGGEGGSAPQPGGLGPAPNVDLASMTPGDAADRLFNRVAEGLAVGDSAEVANFLPMALDAHELARPLDDGRIFRLSFLQRVAADPEASLTTAREGLERSPDHLLLLSAAAEAALELGDEATAGEYYGHMLDVWEAETAADREDYRAHTRLLPIIREQAEQFLAER